MLCDEMTECNAKTDPESTHDAPILAFSALLPFPPGRLLLPEELSIFELAVKSGQVSRKRRCVVGARRTR